MRRPLLLIVLAIAFVLRLVVAVQIDSLPLSAKPQYDSLEYLAWAQHVAAGDFSWPVPPPHGPGYPYFLGALLALFNGSVFAARVVQAMLGTLTCFFIAQSAKRWWGERAGIAAGALLAVYAPLIWIDVSMLAEGLLIALTAAAIWCVATERHPLIIGVLVGLAALVRPTALIELPLFAYAGARTWRMRGALALTCAAVIAPVTIVNARAMHAFVPIQAFGGMNTYLGNSPLRDGLPSARPGGEWDKLESQGDDAYFVAKTKGEIAAHPLQWLALLAKKTVRTLQNDEIRDTHSFYFFADRIPLLRFLPTFTLLFALAAGGLLVKRPHQRFALIYTLLAMLSCVVLVVASRYRMPMVLGLALLGALAIDELFVRRRLAMIVTMVIAAVVTRVWPHPPSHNLAEEWSLTAKSLLADKKSDEAETAARRAIGIDANSALAWDQLGAILATRGKRDGAAAAFAHAVALNPDFERAHVHRGRLMLDSHDARGAVAELRRATALDPHDPVAAQALGNALVQSGDFKAAVAEYERLTTLDPHNAAVLLQLARLEGVLGRPAEGLAHAQRALQMQEATGNDWQLVALLAVQSNHLDLAEDALGRAESALGGTTPQLVFARALIRYQQGRFDEALQLLGEIEKRIPGLPDVRELRAAIERARQK